MQRWRPSRRPLKSGHSEAPRAKQKTTWRAWPEWVGVARGERAYGPRVDPSPRRFGTPDGLAALGLFGGALALALLVFVGLANLGIDPGGTGTTLVLVGAVAFALVVGSGLVLVRRLERATKQGAEAGSRLKVLVEHVPAAVYIDMADPGVSDGGRLAYMSPQVTAILGYRPDELVDDPELWPSRIHPDDREAAIAAYDDHWRTGEPLRAEYRMLARDGTRGLGPRRGLRHARRHAAAGGASRRACSSTRPTARGSSRSSSTTPSTTR